MSEKPPSTARLEAFSDGVIAVIITIMVLELKVPHEDGVAGLYVVLPMLLIYLLSFAFTGIYWINHQHLFRRVAATDRLILYANLGFLFSLSLLPFFTAYVVEKQLSSFAVALYAVSMSVTALSFLLFRLAIYRNLRRSVELEREERQAMRMHLLSLTLYGSAALLAYFHPRLSLILIGLITGAWIVPNLAVPKRRMET